jgi:2-keto-3-deoxy-L-rhamnonate aldolase RhmA
MTEMTEMTEMTDLGALLDNLIVEHGCCALKAGTEWEDMDYSEISQLHSLLGDKPYPIFVKIAGAEARTDLRHLCAIGVNGILGPMVESSYTLEKFVTTVQQVYQGNPVSPDLAINIETIQGYENLDKILDSPYFQTINTVVIGRLDLALSMGFNDVDQPAIQQVTEDLARQVHRRGKRVSVGGFVNPSSAGALQALNIDCLNTIHIMLDLSKVKDASAAVWKALEFEIAYYQALIDLHPEREQFYQSRIITSQTKLDKAAEIFSKS